MVLEIFKRIRPDKWKSKCNVHTISSISFQFILHTYIKYFLTFPYILSEKQMAAKFFNNFWKSRQLGLFFFISWLNCLKGTTHSTYVDWVWNMICTIGSTDLNSEWHHWYTLCTYHPSMKVSSRIGYQR